MGVGIPANQENIQFILKYTAKIELLQKSMQEISIVIQGFRAINKIDILISKTPQLLDRVGSHVETEDSIT